MKSTALLHQHYALTVKIMLAEKELADLREKATAIGSFDYAKDRVKSSGSASARYEKLIEKLVDRENQLADLMEQWMNQKDDVVALIDLINTDTPEGTNQHEVLYLWYVIHLNAKQIAGEMGYTDANIYALRQKGLRKIEQHLNKIK